MINNVVLVGRLTKDPDLRYTSGGQAVATFTLAVNRDFKNADGDREADFINCVIWRKPAETLANYTKKGSLIGIVGRIQTRNYENQQGQRVYVTEVMCDNFQMLESKNSQQNNHQGQQNQQQNESKSNQQQKREPHSQPPIDGMSSHGFNTDSDPFGSSSQIDIADDDLPF